jgi:hypothetical protein
MTLDPHSTLAIAAGVGALSGTHAAIWGMYKDAIHEGFAMRRFVRSMCVGALAAVAIQAALALPLPQASAVVLLFGLAYGTERGIVEVWKTFIRHEDQSKYTIPMQFSVRAVPVASRRVRLAAGFAYVGHRRDLPARHLGVCHIATTASRRYSGRAWWDSSSARSRRSAAPGKMRRPRASTA